MGLSQVCRATLIIRDIGAKNNKCINDGLFLKKQHDKENLEVFGGNFSETPKRDPTILV